MLTKKKKTDTSPVCTVVAMVRHIMLHLKNYYSATEIFPLSNGCTPHVQSQYAI
jgi:hypothetical protein